MDSTKYEVVNLTKKSPKQVPSSSTCRSPQGKLLGTQTQSTKDIGKVLLVNCPWCPHKTKYKWLLTAHIRIHTGEKPFKCFHPECSYVAAQISTLKYHQLTHTRKKNFACPLCHKMFGQKSNLNRHLSIHEPSKPFACPLCPHKSKAKSDVGKHMTSVHSNETPFHCHICTYKTKQKGNLNRHLRWHMGQKSHHCPHCPYKSGQTDDVQKHLRIHTGERPFVCQFCDYTSLQSGQLNGHITRHHTKEKYFNCKFCQYSCVSSSDLVKHMRKHTGEKPFKCQGCGYTTATHSDLSNHAKRCRHGGRIELSPLANLLMIPGSSKKQPQPPIENLDVGHHHHSCKVGGCNFVSGDGGHQLAIHHSKVHKIPIILLRRL